MLGERALRERLARVSKLTSEQLQSESAVPWAGALTYDPTKAAGMDRIQASSQSARGEELAQLKSQGFSISTSHQFPSFAYGYATLYGEHLPLYISADSLLEAVHRSYDEGLTLMELRVLKGDLKKLLTTLRQRQQSNALARYSREVRADVDLLLAVGLSLLDDTAAPPVDGAEAGQLGAYFAAAKEAGGARTLPLFGAPREIDFSQFKPRGHYTTYSDLGPYFRAMIWFGRTELRLVEASPAGDLVLQRRQLDAATALADLLEGEPKKLFDRIDHTVGLFVGEHDSMTVDGIDRLRRDLGAAHGAPLGDEDGKILRTLVEGGHGAQRIASQLLVGGDDRTQPLPHAFQLLGQRYTVDSHVLSSVVYDRVPKSPDAPVRLMPSSLDVAYAALRNDQAATLLQPELQRYHYAPHLARTRVLTEGHGTDYWESSLYTLWLSALQALSPSRAEVSGFRQAGLPHVAATEAWGRRMLNTQLASWAELRRDTILYAKQSYSAGALCEFPDAYVDPYPEFYRQLARYAERGQGLLDTEFTDAERQGEEGQVRLLHEHFSHLREVALRLHDMAQRQRTGQAFTAEQMAFINEAVVLKGGCGGPPSADGWYPNLFLARRSSVKFDPTIADVHTQPTDESGASVGRVLHVGTGHVRRLLVTVETCHGPRAYVGLVSSYHEMITEQFERLDDQQWERSLGSPPPPAPWLAAVLSP